MAVGAETVTVLVLDLLGASALVRDVGVAEAERRRDAHRGALGDLVVAGGGEVVEELGDALLASFHSSAVAVDTAVRMQRYVESADDGFSLCVGLATGEVDAEGGRRFGLPIDEARRLSAVAEGGDVLVTDLVCRVVAGRCSHELRVVGEVSLKGSSHIILAHRVAWRTPERVVTPAPPLAPVALTRRETEVLAELATGRTNREIGQRLALSQHTVANHVRSILAKTSSANRTEAAAWALRRVRAADAERSQVVR